MGSILLIENSFIGKAYETYLMTLLNVSVDVTQNRTVLLQVE